MPKKILDSLIGIQMSRTMLSMKRYLIAEFEASQSPLSFEDWMNLLPLVENGSMSHRDLAHVLGKDKTTISRLVSQWIEKGYVKTEHDTEDQRIKHLTLSKEGKKLHNSLNSVVQKADRGFLKGLEQSEFDLFKKVLTKIQGSLETKKIPSATH
ncbi:hypothetical protein AZI86_01015 [Bdellovibrio bacteriovorus]|uniref:HTH marR-type domain-containing protein n=1 Tax=Bdellovibrio bacteriovorus TaxID=959 RepID=A0A150WMT8_BDEBC|nr:winged helix DNA-binding protein [Bdellovibrio bacteriovorus]KYG65686.1 hypothetical protein AZI86_01015 [Bdellovibrio bacteriovorus]